uniref:Uncharacterized protein n=1 Tax=viral metagenome TaxID=1070528 RepID=A0A6H1ZMY8_9ZZZZ
MSNGIETYEDKVKKLEAQYDIKPTFALSSSTAIPVIVQENAEEQVKKLEKQYGIAPSASTSVAIPPIRQKPEATLTPVEEPLGELKAFLDPFESTRRILKLPQLGRGFEKSILSTPQWVGGLITEAGERAGQQPTDMDRFVAASDGFLQAWNLFREKVSVPLFKKTDLDERVAQFGTDMFQRNVKYILQKYPEAEISIDRFMEALGGAGASLAMALGLTALTGDPIVAASVFGAMAKGRSYMEARTVGKTPEEAGQLSSAIGIGEGAIEAVGLNFLVTRFGTPLMTAAIHAASNSLQEFLQSTSEASIMAATGVRDYEGLMPIIKQAGYEALIGGIIAVPGSGIATNIGDKLRAKGWDSGVADKFSKIIAKNALEQTENLGKAINSEKILQMYSGGPHIPIVEKLVGIKEKVRPSLDQVNLTQKIDQYIQQRGDFPTDPQMQEHYVRLAMQTVEKSARAEIKKQDIFPPKWPLSSVRYLMADAEERSGIAGFARDHYNVQLKTADQHLSMDDSFHAMFKNANINERHLANDNTAKENIKTWLFEEDPVKRALTWAGMDDFSKNSAKVVHAELQGETATSLRYLRWWKWRSVSEKLLPQYTQLLENKKTPDVLKRIGVLEDKLMNAMPKPQHDEQTAIGKDNKRGMFNFMLGKMREADQVMGSQGKEAMMKYLGTQTWGTRKHYYMSEQDFVDFADDFVEFMLPGESIEKSEKISTKVEKIPREAQERRGRTKAAQGNLMTDLYSHIHRVKMMAALVDDVAALSNKIRTATPAPSKSDIKFFSRALKNALGFGEDVPPLYKSLENMNKFFWYTYPLAFSRSAWYTTRNLAQNLALAPGQLSLTEMTKAIKDLVIDGKSPEYMEARDKYFKSRISQKLPMYRHFMMQAQEEAGAKYKGNIVRGLDFIGKIIPMSDEVNRLLLFPVSYRMAENNVKAFKEGKIDFNKFMNRMLFKNLHSVQQMDVMNLLEKNNTTEAIFRIAEMKVENVHFKYRTSERSGMEQFRAQRPIVGLFTWPRGLFETIYRNGLQPFTEGIQTQDYNRAYYGLRSILGTVAGMYAARELLKKTVGKKGGSTAYDITETLFGYSPGSAGFGLAMDIFDNFRNAQQLAFAGQRTKGLSILINRAAYHLPLVQDALNAYEAQGDKRGVTVMSFFSKELRKNIRNEKRDPVNAWRHVIWGTQERMPKETDSEKRVRQLESMYLF